MKPAIWLKQNKVGSRKLLRPWYEHRFDGLLVVFEQEKIWRLSFIAEIRERKEGELVKKQTTPRRFTYLLGQDQKVRVAAERLEQLRKEKLLGMPALFHAFSVEALNEEFYKGVAEHFYHLVGKEQSEGCLQLPSLQPEDNQTTYRNFAVRLIGRIVFCWFLKMKCSDLKTPLLPESWLPSQAVAENSGYYHEVLEPLFFEILNTPAEQRRSELPAGAEKIPFLNGGLFAPHGEDSFKIEHGRVVVQFNLVILDEWFTNFFKFLEKYHFILDENSLNDAEVSVDPEMLGRIFENLLAEIDPESGQSERKSTESFYTPREIVDFMVQESLTHALRQKTGFAEEKLRALFEENSSEHDFSETETNALLDALFALKILDPACGSGAFPMGILHKMIVALEKLDPQAEGWIERQMKSAVLQQEVKEKLSAAKVEYARKIGLVQHSIYGVDLQPMATGIAQLRCFLTLVVDAHVKDEEPNRGIQPLPNLEFKFVTADALGKLPQERQMRGFSSTVKLNALKDLRKDYLLSTGEKKEAIQWKFYQLRTEIIDEQIGFGAASNASTFALIQWNPFDLAALNIRKNKADWFDPEWMFGVDDGFDLVLGNPPYIQLEKSDGKLSKFYKPLGYETFKPRGDIYILFYERGLELLQPGGHSCFITSNKWMRTGYGERLRGFLAEQNPLQLLDLGPGSFTATVDTNILLVQQTANQDQLRGRTLQTKHDLTTLNPHNLPALPPPSRAAWVILNRAEQGLKEKIEQHGTPLKDWSVKIHYGIKTGCNDAFILSSKQRDALIEQDPQSAQILKPILSGRDIQRYSHQWNGLWVIFIPWHFPLHKNTSIVGASKETEMAFQKEYPVIYNHLLQYKDDLSKRNKAETGIRYEWYALQRCAATYYQAFEEEKVVWQEMTERPCFFYDDQKMFCNDTGRILTGERVKFFVGFFNSRFFEFAFSNYYAGGGLGKKGVRYKSEFMKAFPIPAITSSNGGLVVEIEGLVDVILSKQSSGASNASDEAEIDELVFALYGLSEKEQSLLNDEG